jgi:peptidoglycan/LPS O-acetylase OafA/YrhL
MRFYLPQLDGLRFFAFFVVFFHHFPSAEKFFSPESLLAKFFHFVNAFGWIGVDLFLVLSAFLITKLLLLEYASEQHISLKSFYIRRILRIWPLYFFMVVIGFVILPYFNLFGPGFHDPFYQQMTNQHLLPYLLFLGNFSVALHGYSLSWTLSHLWTVGIEEQFYLLWPALLCVLVRKNTQSVYGTLLALLLFTFACRGYLVNTSAHPMLWTNTLTRLDPLLMGIFLAFYRNGTPARQGLAIPKFLIGIACVFVISFVPNIDKQTLHVMWQYPLVAFGFMLVIDACVTSNQGILPALLSNKLLVWLGKLTYGLYVYHIIAIQFGEKWTARLFMADTVPDASARWIITFSISLVLTIVFAAASYYLLEKKFLQLKNKFSHIVSRPV